MTEKLYNVLSICHHYVMSCKYWWDILQFFSRTDCQDILGKNCEKLQSKFVEITVQILWVPFFQIWCTTVSTCIWYRRFSVTPCMCMAYFFHFPAAAACRSLLVMVHWSLLVATRIGWSSNVALSDHMVWLHASTKKSHVSVAASFNSQSLLCHWTRNIEWADAQRTQTNNFRRQIGARLCRCCRSTTSPGSTVLRHRRRFRHRHRPIVVVVCTRSTWTSWLVQPLCRRLPGGRSPWTSCCADGYRSLPVVSCACCAGSACCPARAAAAIAALPITLLPAGYYCINWTPWHFALQTVTA